MWLLKGRTNYGDSVADEWVIVYLLRELSRQFPSAWVRVYDTDGEFLLIEAANALPKWLNPEIADNRVWIHDHKMHIIPLDQAEPARPLSLTQALGHLQSPAPSLVHIPAVDAEAFHPMEDYPSAISKNKHCAAIPLPRKLAAILHANPSFISSAVEAFYLRDPVTVKLIQPKHNSKRLYFPPDDWTTSSVQFTKTLYAQLRCQHWEPPEPWARALASLSETAPSARAKEKLSIGVKVTAGFEMLCQDHANQDKRDVREIRLLLEDFESGEESLPMNEEMKTWSVRDDDDSWLDIDFNDFEKELAGRNGPHAPTEESGTGFGDKAAQEKLRKIVERFESFLEDDGAGLDGAEGLDEMDFDDDDDEGGSIDSDHEDSEEAFDETKLAEMMRNMINTKDNGDVEGSEEAFDEMMRNMLNTKGNGEIEDKELEEIQSLSKAMEAELHEHGALTLDPKSGHGAQGTDAPTSSGDSTDEEPDAQYNLAQNILESFKAQAGMAGPAGNMMGLMGVKMPRDEDEEIGHEQRGSLPI